MEDSNGNVLTASYYKSEGGIYLNEIHYPGNNIIKFIPDNTARPDTYPVYTTGSAAVMADRLKTIETYADGSLAARYELEYEPDHGQLATRLASITRYGSDGITSLPATRFTYKSRSEYKAIGHQYNAPERTVGYTGTTGDFNADGLTDVLVPGNPGYSRFMMSQGNGQFEPVPAPESVIYSARWGTGDFDGDGTDDIVGVSTYRGRNDDGFLRYIERVELFLMKRDGIVGPYIIASGSSLVPGLWIINDFDGDGKADLAHHYAQKGGPPRDPHWNRYIRTLIFNGDGTFSVGTTHLIDHNFDEERDSIGTWISGDLNGDGRADLFYHNEGGSLLPHGVGYCLISQADGTVTAIGHTVLAPVAYYSKVNTVRGDFNGDGLDDISYPGCGGSGHGSNEDGWVTTHFSTGEDGVSKQVVFQYPPMGSQRQWHAVDVNGDGLDDLMGFDFGWTSYVVLISNGDGTFEATAQHYKDSGLIIFTDQTNVGDFNGDGTGDIIIMRSQPNPTSVLITDTASRTGLLEKIAVEKGAVVDLEYRPSSTYENTLMPFVIPTLWKMTVTDGVADTDGASITRYFYHGGLYNFQDREFRGFEWTKQYNADGSVEKHWFHQDRFRRKLAWQVEHYAEDPVWPWVRPMVRTTYDWHEIPENDPWGHVKLNQERSEYYDDVTVFSQQDHIYDDDNGNLKQTTLTGTGTEPIVHTFDYNNFGEWTWRQTLDKTKGASETLVSRETLFRYESGTGNLLETEQVNHDGANPIRRYTYDSYGNLEDEYDAKGNPPTHYVYDTTTHTFPVRITNPKGYVTLKDWDVRFGKENWVEDPNGRRTNYDYDEFGRLITTDFPDGGQTRKVFHDYCDGGDCTDVQFPLHVVTRVKETDASFIDTHVYYDGLGRQVQSVARGEDQYIISKTHYDPMGRKAYESGSFHQPASDFLNWMPDDYIVAAYPYVRIEYDRRGRPLLMESRDGQNGLIKTGFAYSGA